MLAGQGPISVDTFNSLARSLSHSYLDPFPSLVNGRIDENGMAGLSTQSVYEAYCIIWEKQSFPLVRARSHNITGESISFCSSSDNAHLIQTWPPA